MSTGRPQTIDEVVLTIEDWFEKAKQELIQNVSSVVIDVEEEGQCEDKTLEGHE